MAEVSLAHPWSMTIEAALGHEFAEVPKRHDRLGSLEALRASARRQNYPVTWQPRPPGSRNRRRASLDQRQSEARIVQCRASINSVLGMIHDFHTR
jgi:hypothetical protein